MFDSLQRITKKSHEFLVVSGMVDVPQSSADQVLAVAVVMQVIPETLEVKQ
jgi:hypothetical protein